MPRYKCASLNNAIQEHDNDANINLVAVVLRVNVAVGERNKMQRVCKLEPSFRRL
jgi:hypothetical protein